MKRILRNCATLWLLCLLTICCFTSRVAAQNNANAQTVQGSAGEPTLQELVSEVRRIRIALEQSNRAALRFQVAFERLKLQQAAVDALQQRVENLRQVFEVEGESSSSFQTELIKDIESRIGQETDPTRRAELEQQMRGMRQGLEYQKQREQQLRTREGQLGAQLEAERVKLAELNRQLDELERQLPTEAKAQ